MQALDSTVIETLGGCTHIPGRYQQDMLDRTSIHFDPAISTPRQCGLASQRMGTEATVHSSSDGIADDAKSVEGALTYLVLSWKAWVTVIRCDDIL